MEEIGFVVESSLGELEVKLLRDGWTRVQFLEPVDDAVIVEEITRHEGDLAEALKTLGIPGNEAAELANELWEELTEEERKERANTPGPRRT